MTDNTGQPPYLDEVDALRDRVRELEDKYLFALQAGYTSNDGHVGVMADLAIRLKAAEAELKAARIEYSKCDNCLREKDRAMGVLFARLSKAGVDCSDLMS